MVKKTHIVIIGGGFGGLRAAIDLAKTDNFRVTLISDQPYFLHHATFYSTAAGHDIKRSVVPIRDILRPYQNIAFVHDEVISIEPTTSKVIGKKRAYQYDELVMALGLVDNVGGLPGAATNTHGIASLEAIARFQQDFHKLCIHQSKITCAIIGAGPTGVELAGALKEYADAIIDAHQLTEAHLAIEIIDSANRVLPQFSSTASQKVTKQLETLNINLRLSSVISKITPKTLTINGEHLPIDMAIWTCGGHNHPIYAAHPEIFRLSKKGRVIVNQYTSAYPHIYVIGDNAEMPDSGSAAAALRHGRFVAKHISRLAAGTHPKAYRPKKYLVTIPARRFWAYAEKYGLYVAGFSGALVRRWFELSSYHQFLPLRSAWRAWRHHKDISPTCSLCIKQSKKSVK